MSSTGVNVLRYTALASGICYGLYRQALISAQTRIAATDREYHNQSNLIQRAKAEYVKKTLPGDKLTSGGGVISDPDDPKFDLEAYLTTKMADEAK